MTYVLLVIRDETHPDYIQGTIEEINEALRRAMDNDSISADDWAFYKNWKLLSIEDDQLTPVNRYHVRSVPQFEVY